MKNSPLHDTSSAVACTRAISFLTFAAAAALSTAACGGTTDLEKPRGDSGSSDQLILGTPAEPQDPGEPLNEPWMLIQPCSPSAPSDQIDIKEVTTDGSRLSVAAGHGGGCEQHSYGLCYSEQWAESDPVQIRLQLMHDAHDDSCEAYLTTTLYFDLGPLEEEYKQAYQTEGGEMRLSLGERSFGHAFGTEGVQTWEEIHSTIERLNICNTVADCRSIEVEPCTHAYVSANADITELQESIQARQELEFGGGFGCDLACACGVLSCQEGRCVAEASGCEDLPAAPDTQMICL